MATINGTIDMLEYALAKWQRMKKSYSASNAVLCEEFCADLEIMLSLLKQPQEAADG